MSKQTLEKITRRVIELIGICDASCYEVSDLIFQARREFFPDDTLEWLDWAKTEFQFSRRHTFRMARVAYFRQKILGGGQCLTVALKQLADVGFSKIDILATIPIHMVEEFLRATNIAKLDRDELRDAVNAFLGKKPNVSEQVDFFEQLGLPDPGKLDGALRANSQTFSPGRAADYAGVFAQHAVRRIDELSAEERRVFRANMDLIMKEGFGLDVSALANRKRG